MKILIIEDEQSVSAFIKRGFEEQGNTVIQAFDGISGLKLAYQHNFDVIILDVVMPGMNGIEVCDKLKNQQGIARTDIFESVWEVDFDLRTNVIEVYMNYLRKKIEHGFSSKIIKTVVGMGYIIKE